MTLWLGAAPSATGANSLMGGWVPTTGGTCCSELEEEPCEAYEGCFPGGTMMACYNDPEGDGWCGPGDDQPCNGTPECSATYNGECS
ncbi:MAG: hypothetical protein H8D47_03760 [Planctomycetes bacterium]|nr:hypothetical protein [Planctomycetota bacterium]